MSAALSNMKTAYLALGGNLGDRQAILESALDSIANAPSLRLTTVSSFYETPPWGPVPQGPYLNACCRIETSLDPQALLDLCLAIEHDHGRERRERWGPRTLDLDVLVYGDLRVGTERLSLPHPRLTERGFVLVPLAEIAPDLVVEGRTIAQWARLADTTDIVRQDRKTA